MAYEQRNNSGSIFRNDKEGGNADWPDYKGKAIIDGKEFWVSGWIKKTNDGKSFMSLSFKPKVKQETENKPTKKDPIDDRLPF